MEEGREFRGMRNPFDVFGSSTTSVFGRNPFDYPFVTNPSGSVSTQATPLNENPSKGPVIHELDSDDEREGEVQDNEGDKDDNGSKMNKEPFVDHPYEEPKIGKNEIVGHRADLNKAEGTSNFQFHTSKVTYGGVDGAYYTCSSTRRMGDDGLLMEECKEADKRTGEAKHRVSRGIHDKGHSLTRKLNADGKVETLQTLHNLNQDELETFENSWRGNAGRHIPSSRGDSSTAHTGSGSSVGGMSDWLRLLPSSRRAESGGGITVSSNRQKPKKVVRINIE